MSNVAQDHSLASPVKVSHSSNQIVFDASPNITISRATRVDDNPYQSPTKSGNRQRPRGTNWLVWSGLICSLIAALCGIGTFGGMMWSFQIVADASSTLEPSELANRISNTLLPAIGVVPFGLIGIILLFIGIIRGRR